MRILYILIFCGLSLAWACVPPEVGERRDKNKIQVDLSDPQVQRLFQFRDERRTDSLTAYLQHPDATLRYLSALAFASFGDSTAVQALAPLLDDPVDDIRVAAAFSLGQTRAPQAVPFLIKAFEREDSLSDYQRFNAVVLEAVGKCGDAENLRDIATVKTYQPTDTLLLEGQCRAIYRFGLRHIVDTAATARMIAYLVEERLPHPARLMAANYLARVSEVTPDSLQAVRIAAAYVRSGNPEVRMALATALGKSASKPAFAMLSKVIQTERDWRVQCNLIQALGKFEYDTVRNLVLPFVSNTNPHISRTAAEFFIKNGQAKDGDFYWRIANDRENQNLPWPTKAALFRASNRWLSSWDNKESKDYVVYRIREMFLQSNDPYARAAWIGALSEYGWQYRFIYEKGMNDAHPAVKTAAAEALAAIAGREDFYRIFGEGARGARRELYGYFREIIAANDPGAIASVAPALESTILNFKEISDSTRIPDLQAALAKLKMPRDLEAYAALNKALAYFEGTSAPPPFKPAFNHPISWQALSNFTGATRVKMQTQYGEILLELYPQWAPGSVANFLKLAGEGFYDGKIAHRVVPNFVVQSGCPRGDGYGALDYTLRTEIGPVWYDGAGYLGMASAGTDTEGTQWFITHAPTPHLDGRYTIFGRVKEGMEVVNQIQPGDVIEKVAVLK
jgi:cyclophilin family peptidyl-prolyl cis-trans isomerase/HEAT repeat protein